MAAAAVRERETLVQQRFEALGELKATQTLLVRPCVHSDSLWKYASAVKLAPTYTRRSLYVFQAAATEERDKALEVLAAGGPGISRRISGISALSAVTVPRTPATPASPGEPVVHSRGRTGGKGFRVLHVIVCILDAHGVCASLCSEIIWLRLVVGHAADGDPQAPSAHALRRTRTGTWLVFTVGSRERMLQAHRIFRLAGACLVDVSVFAGRGVSCDGPYGLLPAVAAQCEAYRYSASRGVAGAQTQSHCAPGRRRHRRPRCVLCIACCDV